MCFGSYPQFLGFPKSIHIVLVVDSRTFALAFLFFQNRCIAVDAIANSWSRPITVMLQFVSISSGAERVLLFEHRPESHRLYAVRMVEDTVHKVRTYEVGEKRQEKSST